MDPHRLPRTVVPSRYDLILRPDLAAATFTGTVVITVKVMEPTRELVLNAAELAPGKVELLVAGQEPVVPSLRLEAVTERCHLTFPAPLAVGEAQLRLEFTGTLNEQMRGFYLSRFRDATGVERRIAATQFEATDARRALPCWDEPSFKAVFGVTLVVPADLAALSNGAVLREEVQGGEKIVRFADTIPMSTYLLAFVVGPLVPSAPVLVGTTPVRAWCVPSKLPLTAFGVDIAAASLRFFEDFYGVPYPGGKLDLVALPDFAAGAMENFGCITFRETALLVDEATATHQERERVADVVAHENAHLWFGDLVTMDWWNGLWLNEAFATFMEMLAVDRYRPEWQRWVTFGVSRSAALLIDGLGSSRPVEFPVYAPADAEAMFDVLTYEKGASVLRMLQQYLGEEVFRDGVRRYLHVHAYGNTEGDDLWAGLSEASGQAVGELMQAWIFRAGYPVVTARRDGDNLELSQERFLYLGTPQPEDALPWSVPVHVRIDTAEGITERRVLLKEKQQRMALPEGATLVLVNAGGHGFYRCRHEGDLQERLLDNQATLAAIDRFNLVNDAWAAVLAGLSPVTDYLRLAERFRNESDRNVWAVLLGSFAYLSRMIDEVDRPALARWVRSCVGPAVARLGLQPGPKEGELIDALRGDLVRALGVLGEDKAVQREAAVVFASGSASPGVRAAAVSILAHTGGEARYEEFLACFRSAKTPQEEQRFLLALGGFREPALVRRTLALTLDGVRAQDAPQLLRVLLQQPHSRAEAWEFFQSRWEELSQRVAGPGLRRLCEGVTALATVQWEEQVKAFFSSRSIVLGGKTVAQILEQLRIAVVFRERNAECYGWRCRLLEPEG